MKRAIRPDCGRLSVGGESVLRVIAQGLCGLLGIPKLWTTNKSHKVEYGRTDRSATVMGSRSVGDSKGGNLEIQENSGVVRKMVNRVLIFHCRKQGIVRKMVKDFSTLNMDSRSQ